MKRICMIWIFSKPQLNFKKKKKANFLQWKKAYIIHFLLYCSATGFGDGDSFSVPGFSNHTAFDLVPSSAG